MASGLGWWETIARRSGVAGLVVAAGGGCAAAGAVTPWWQAHAELSLSGVAQGRPVTGLLGVEHLAGVAAAGAAVVALLLGLSLAIDRHPGWTRPALLGAGGVAAATASVGTWWTPGLGRFPDRGGALGELRDVVGELPMDVELTLTVIRGPGTALTAIGAGLIVLGTAAARELDRR